MFCTKCGLQLDDQARFCSQCGASTGKELPPGVVRKLTRSVVNKKIAGVCGGMAAYLDADPVLVRVLWLILTFALPPAGIIGYIAAWIVMPQEPLIPASYAPISVPQG